MRRRVIDDQGAIDPQARPLIRSDTEGVGFVVSRLDLAGPADGKRLWIESVNKRTGTPSEVHHVVDADRDSLQKGGIVEVFADKARAARIEGQGKGRRGAARWGLSARIGGANSVSIKSGGE